MFLECATGPTIGGQSLLVNQYSLPVSEVVESLLDFEFERAEVRLAGGWSTRQKLNLNRTPAMACRLDAWWRLDMQSLRRESNSVCNPRRTIDFDRPS